MSPLHPGKDLAEKIAAHSGARLLALPPGSGQQQLGTGQGTGEMLCLASQMFMYKYF